LWLKREKKKQIIGNHRGRNQLGEMPIKGERLLEGKGNKIRVDLWGSPGSALAKGEEGGGEKLAKKGLREREGGGSLPHSNTHKGPREPTKVRGGRGSRGGVICRHDGEQKEKGEGRGPEDNTIPKVRGSVGG